MTSWKDIATAPKDGSDFEARCGLYPPTSAYFNGTVFVHDDRDDGEIAYPFTHWRPRPAEWRCSECGAAADERHACCQALRDHPMKGPEDE